MPPEDALAYGVEQWGRSEAQDTLARALMDVPLWKPHSADDGLGRWREALTTIGFRHGVKHLKDRLEAIGQGDAEIPQEAFEAALSVESDMDQAAEAYKSRM